MPLALPVHASLALLSQTIQTPLRVFDGMTLGRTTGAVKFPEDETLGDPHLRLQIDPQTGLTFCEDLGSGPGTWINGTRLKAFHPTPLQPGDLLLAGAQKFTAVESGIVRPARKLRIVV